MSIEPKKSHVNQQMRALFLKRMADAGMPLDQVLGLHKNVKLFKGESDKLTGGKTVLLRTNKKHRAIVAKAEGPRATDRINIEQLSPDFIGHTMRSATGDGFDTYLIPTDVVVKMMQENHAAWLKRTPDGNSDVRILNFEEPDVLERLSRYKITGDGEIEVVTALTARMVPRDRPTDRRTFGEVIDHYREQMAAEIGIPAEMIQISVTFPAHK